MRDKKLVMSVFQCPSCRFGLKLKSDSLIENLLFVGLFLCIAIAIYYSRLMNLSVLFPIAFIFGAYGLLKPKKWGVITEGEMCKQCHYDLYGLEDPSQCPECGEGLKDQEDSTRSNQASGSTSNQ